MSVIGELNKLPVVTGNLSAWEPQFTLKSKFKNEKHPTFSEETCQHCHVN